MYHLHPTLAADTIYLGQLTLCDVLLMNNSHYLWLILVPQRENIKEVYELLENDQQLLLKESSQISEKLAFYSKAHKINIAAIGNQVEQLHIHIVARHQHDLAWPKPIWGNTIPKPYSLIEQKKLTVELRELLTLDLD